MVRYYNIKDSSLKRTIISRAYYSIFLALRDYVKNNYNNYSVNKSEHQYLPKFIKINKIFDKYSRRIILDTLYKLKNNRVRCD